MTEPTPNALLEHFAQYKPESLVVIRVTLGKDTYVGVHGKTRRDAGTSDEYLYEWITLVGKVPKGNRTAYHLPQDGREWYVSSWFDAKTASPEHLAKQPLGSNFSLRPWVAAGGARIDEFDRKPYKRVDVGLEKWGGQKFVPVPHDPATKYPWPLPPRREKPYDWIKVTPPTGPAQFYQYNWEMALCVAYGQQLGQFNPDACLAAHRSHIHLGSEWHLHTLFGFESSYVEFKGDRGRSGRQVTFAELLSMMDWETHPKLIEFARDAGTEGFVLYESHMMDSSNLGHRTVLPYGPGRSIATREGCPPRIGDLPSRFEELECWCTVPEHMEKGN